MSKFNTTDNKTKLQKLLEQYPIKRNSLAFAAGIPEQAMYNTITRYGCNDYVRAQKIFNALRSFNVPVEKPEDILDAE